MNDQDDRETLKPVSMMPARLMMVPMRHRAETHEMHATDSAVLISGLGRDTDIRPQETRWVIHNYYFN